MAENTAAKVAAFTGTAAAVFALINSRKASASASYEFPPEVIEILGMIAQGMDITVSQLEQIIEAIGGISTGGGPIQVQGYPNNVPGIIVARVQITALGLGIQMPDIPVPNGFTVLCKGAPTNVGVVYTGGSQNEAVNIETAWPLLPQENIRYAVTNINQIYAGGIAAGGSVVGDFVICTVEFPRGGGGQD